VRPILIAIFCAATASAAAQTEQTAPPAAVHTHREPPQTLSATMTVSASDADEEGGAGSTTAGPHSDLDGSLTYDRHEGRATLTMSGRSVVRYDQSIDKVESTRNQESIDFAVNGGRNKVHVAERAAYSPYYQFGASPGAAASAIDETSQAHGDFANAPLTAFESSLVADATRVLSHRATLSATYDWRSTLFNQSYLNFSTGHAAIAYENRIGRSLIFRAGYGYRTARSSFAGVQPVQMHDIDVGVDYRRALTLSRRTTVSFSSGSAMTPTSQGTGFHLTGDAIVGRQLSRTWTARMAFTRAVQVFEGFTQPMLSNAVTASVSGNLGRRVAFASSFGVAAGRAGGGGERSGGYENRNGNVGLSVSLSRYTGLDAQYFLYGHRVDEQLIFAPDFPTTFMRQGVRVGLTWRTTPVVNGKDRR
jgi:hypothetical protein